jgi:hypothetical protein
MTELAIRLTPRQTVEDVRAEQSAEIERERAQARQWADYLRDAGYEVVFMYTGQPEPFDCEWQVWTPGGRGKRVASIDIDGCGASWHGPDELFQVIADRLDKD